MFKARKMLTVFGGNKSENLDEVGIIKETVEKVAKRTSDKVVAPIFMQQLALYWALEHQWYCLYNH